MRYEKCPNTAVHYILPCYAHLKMLDRQVLNQFTNLFQAVPKEAQLILERQLSTASESAGIIESFPGRSGDHGAANSLRYVVKISSQILCILSTLNLLSCSFL